MEGGSGEGMGMVVSLKVEESMWWVGFWERSHCLVSVGRDMMVCEAVILRFAAVFKRVVVSDSTVY